MISESHHGAFSVSDIRCRYGNRMGKPLCIHGKMSFDTRDLFLGLLKQARLIIRGFFIPLRKYLYTTCQFEKSREHSPLTTTLSQNSAKNII